MREYRILSERGSLTVGFGRHRFPPWGVAGGMEGSVNYVEVVPADGSQPRRFGKAARFRLSRGDLVRLVTGTGGGYGDPRGRDPALVAEDLADGIVTEREAREVYGLRPP